MLNLTQTHSSVNSLPQLNPNIRGGNYLAINEAYRRIKASGWSGTGQTHSRHRVPTFSLGNAITYRDKSGEHDWIVEFQDAGRGYRIDIDDPAHLAAYVAGLPEYQDAAPAPSHPADVHAADLAAEYGHDFGGRLGRAVELVKAGSISDHETSYDGSAGFFGMWQCNCPDAQFRAPRAKFGLACKHCLAGEISRRIEAESDGAAYRKSADRWERRRSEADPRPGVPTITKEQAERIKREIEEQGSGIREQGSVKAGESWGGKVEGDKLTGVKISPETAARLARQNAAFEERERLAQVSLRAALKPGLNARRNPWQV